VYDPHPPAIGILMSCELDLRGASPSEKHYESIEIHCGKPLSSIRIACSFHWKIYTGIRLAQPGTRSETTL